MRLLLCGAVAVATVLASGCGGDAKPKKKSDASASAPAATPGTAPGSAPGTAPGSAPGTAPGSAPGTAPSSAPGSSPTAQAAGTGLPDGLAVIDAVPPAKIAASADLKTFCEGKPVGLFASYDSMDSLQYAVCLGDLELFGSTRLGLSYIGSDRSGPHYFGMITYTEAGKPAYVLVFVRRGATTLSSLCRTSFRSKAFDRNGAVNLAVKPFEELMQGDGVCGRDGGDSKSGVFFTVKDDPTKVRILLPSGKGAEIVLKKIVD